MTEQFYLDTLIILTNIIRDNNCEDVDKDMAWQRVDEVLKIKPRTQLRSLHPVFDNYETVEQAIEKAKEKLPEMPEMLRRKV